MAILPDLFGRLSLGTELHDPTIDAAEFGNRAHVSLSKFRFSTPKGAKICSFQQTVLFEAYYQCRVT